MKLISLQKLNGKGVAHFLIPLTVVLLVAVGGTFLLVASHADPVSSKKKPQYGTVKVVMYNMPKIGCIKGETSRALCKGCFKTDSTSVPYQDGDFTNSFWKCQGIRPKVNRTAHLDVVETDYGPHVTTCNGREVGGLPADFGTVRTLKCLVGSSLSLSPSAKKEGPDGQQYLTYFTYTKDGTSKVLIEAHAGVVIKKIEAHKTYKVVLGVGDPSKF